MLQFIFLFHCHQNYKSYIHVIPTRKTIEQEKRHGQFISLCMGHRGLCRKVPSIVCAKNYRSLEGGVNFTHGPTVTEHLPLLHRWRGTSQFFHLFLLSTSPDLLPSDCRFSRCLLPVETALACPWRQSCTWQLRSL